MMENLMRIAEENGRMKAALNYLYADYMDSIEKGYLFETEMVTLQIAGYDVPTKAKKKENKEEKADETV